MDLKDPKRSEKLLKRLKPLLDEKLKTKQRLKGLQAFLEISTDEENLKYFSDYAEDIFAVVFDSITAKISKIREKFHNATTRDSLMLFELLDIFYLVAKNCVVKINTGWQRPNIVALLNALLFGGNYIKLRRVGLKILLEILCRQKAFSEDLLGLFMNVIPLAKFSRQPMGPECWYFAHTKVPLFLREQPDTLNLNFDERQTIRIARETNPPVNISSGTIIPRELSETAAALELFNMLLDEIKSTAIGGASQLNIPDYTYDGFLTLLHLDGFLTLRNIWKLFRSHYLSALFPLVCDILEMNFPEKTTHSLSLCPKELLDSLLTFIESSIADIHLAETSTAKELASAFLHTLIWCDYGNTEIVLEAVRQAFLYRDIRTSLTILCKWIKLGSISSKETTGSVHSKDVSTQLLIQRCVPFFQFAHAGDFTETQAEILFDQIYFVRYLIQENNLDLQTTECLMVSLLRTLDSKQKFLSSESGNEVFHQFAETIWYTWVKCETNDLDWKRLEEIMSKYKGHIAVVKPWSVIATHQTLVLNLTALIAQHVYGRTTVELKSDIDKYRRNRAKIREPGVHLNIPIVDSNQRKILSEVEIVAAGTTTPLTADKFNSEDNIDQDDIFMYMKLKSDAFRTITKREDQNLVTDLKNIISSLGKIHEISYPIVHLEVILTLVQSWELFEKVHYLSSHFVKKAYNRFELAGIFFKCLAMSFEYKASISVAVSVLCKMLCSRHDQLFPTEWLRLFYAMVEAIFVKYPESVQFSLISGSSRLFSSSLPSCLTLVPIYLRKYADLSSKTDLPVEVVTAMIHTLGGLLSTKGILKSTDAILTLSANDRLHIRDILHSLLKNQCRLRNLELSESILWMLGLYIVEDSGYPPVSFSDTAMIVLDYISFRDFRVASAATDSLSLIAANCVRLKLSQEDIIVVLDRILFAVPDHLSHGKNKKELALTASILAKIYKCLVDWLMVIPLELVENPNISLRLSEIVEETFHFSISGMKGVIDPSTLQKDEEMHFAAIRESAEIALLHLTHHIGNYAPFYGPAMLSSTINDYTAEDLALVNSHVVFALQGHVLLTIVEVNAGKASKVSKIRIILRNPVGKFVYDFDNFYTMPGDISTKLINSPVRYDPNLYPVAGSRKTSRNVKTSSIGCISNPEEAIKDFLATIIDSLQTINPEFVYKSDPIRNFEDDFFKQIRINIPEHEEAESEIIGDEDINSITGKATLKIAKVQPMGSQSTPAIFQNARLFLAQMGLLSFDYLKDGSVHMLGKSPSLLRDIKGVDKKHTRNVAKFAVLYVGLGQENEFEIYQNRNGSQQYEDFVKSLGWEIDLATHPGYTGGLEPDMCINGKALYYCASTTEIIYHEATRLISDTDDPKHLKKKRHIGNDHVHIIWNEHIQDYKFETIGGDFGNAQIVITPLPGQLFAIDIYKDETVMPFGPLQRHNVVGAEFLGCLVRHTALNAYCMAHLCSSGPAQHPFTLRKETIDIISTRHKIHGDSFEKVLGSVFREAKDETKET